MFTRSNQKQRGYGWRIEQKLLDDVKVRGVVSFLPAFGALGFMIGFSMIWLNLFFRIHDLASFHNAALVLTAAGFIFMWVGFLLLARKKRQGSAFYVRRLAHMNIFSKHFILLGYVMLVGCASHSKHAAQSQSDAVPTPIVATCATYTPTFQNVMVILHDHGIHCGTHISGTAIIYVYPEEAAKARELLSSVAKDAKFEGLEVVE
jgi:hypothetical protein